MSRRKELLYHEFHVVRVKRLTTEHVQIHVVRLLAEVSGNVRCLDKLNHGVSSLVSGAKVLDGRRSERNHVDFGDQSGREKTNVVLVPDCVRDAASAVKH